MGSSGINPAYHGRSIRKYFSASQVGKLSVKDLEDIFRDEVQSFFTNSGGCRVNSLQRRLDALQDRSMAILTRPEELVYSSNQCIWLTDSIPVLFSFDVARWMKRLTAEHPSRELEFGRVLKSLLQLNEWNSNDAMWFDSMPRPRGLPSSTMAWNVCIDWSCRNEREDERAEVVWALFVHFLAQRLDVKKQVAKLPEETPGPQERYIREIVWADGHLPDQHLNLSAMLRRIRFQPFK